MPMMHDEMDQRAGGEDEEGWEVERMPVVIGSQQQCHPPGQPG